MLKTPKVSEKLTSRAESLQKMLDYCTRQTIEAMIPLETTMLERERELHGSEVTLKTVRRDPRYRSALIAFLDQLPIDRPVAALIVENMPRVKAALAAEVADRVFNDKADKNLDKLEALCSEAGLHRDDFDTALRVNGPVQKSPLTMLEKADADWIPLVVKKLAPKRQIEK